MTHDGNWQTNENTCSIPHFCLRFLTLAVHAKCNKLLTISVPRGWKSLAENLPSAFSPFHCLLCRHLLFDRTAPYGLLQLGWADHKSTKVLSQPLSSSALKPASGRIPRCRCCKHLLLKHLDMNNQSKNKHKATRIDCNIPEDDVIDVCNVDLISK